MKAKKIRVSKHRHVYLVQWMTRDRNRGSYDVEMTVALLGPPGIYFRTLLSGLVPEATERAIERVRSVQRQDRQLLTSSHVANELISILCDMDFQVIPTETFRFESAAIEFRAMREDSTDAWDECSPIHVGINTAGMYNNFVLQRDEMYRRAREQVYRVVYFMQSDVVPGILSKSAIKIGTTGIDVVDRAVQVARDFFCKVNVLGTIPGGFITEHELHSKFAHLHRGREWFEDAKELRAYIEQYAKPVTTP